MAWTEERIETLKQRWREGASLTEISIELDVSRGAISGKLDRLGMFEPSEGAHRVRRARKPKKKRAPMTYRKRWTPEAPLVPIEPQETETAMAIPDDVIPQGQRKSLLDLTGETCKWPIGDPGTPEFFFCGAQSVTGLPYCVGHCRAAYDRRSRTPERYHWRDHRVA